MIQSELRGIKFVCNVLVQIKQKMRLNEPCQNFDEYALLFSVVFILNKIGTFVFKVNGSRFYAKRN